MAARSAKGKHSAAAASLASPRVTTLRTPSGASAEVTGELLVLRDRRGSVVVVFDAETGAAEISAPGGDLTLAAPQGRVLICAATDVEIKAERKAELRAPDVAVNAGRLELTAERILERAGDMYRELDGLLHTRAGRVRTLVRDVYQLFAKRSSIVAEEDAAMDGKRVLLG